jgi:hypothetical protein
LGDADGLLQFGVEHVEQRQRAFEEQAGGRTATPTRRLSFARPAGAEGCLLQATSGCSGLERLPDGGEAPEHDGALAWASVPE